MESGELDRIQAVARKVNEEMERAGRFPGRRSKETVRLQDDLSQVGEAGGRAGILVIAGQRVLEGMGVPVDRGGLESRGENLRADRQKNSRLADDSGFPWLLNDCKKYWRRRGLRRGAKPKRSLPQAG
jgi:hypothetical protein